MKHKIKKAGKLYHPKFTHFQTAYMKFQRGVSFVCALAGLALLSPFFFVSMHMDPDRQRKACIFYPKKGNKIKGRWDISVLFYL